MDTSVSGRKVIGGNPGLHTMIFCSQCTQGEWWQQQERGLNRQRTFLPYWILYYCIHSSWVNMHILDPGEASSPPLQVLLGKISRLSHMHSTNMQGQPLHVPWYFPPRGRKKKPPAESTSCLHGLWKPCTDLQSSIQTWPRNLLKRGTTWTQNLLDLSLIQGASGSTG